MDRMICIGDKEVGFRATALTPRLYRHWLSRDVISDMATLQKNMLKAQGGDFTIVDLEIFENLAWVMAKQYDNTVPDLETWLDGFDSFSVYDILPELLDLWNANQTVTSHSKKK